MAKHKTRKQKISPHHPFVLTWKNKSQTGSSKPDVKRQSKNSNSNLSTNMSKSKNAELSAQDESLAINKKGILKSILLASLIFAIELVIYLIWNTK